MAAETFRIEIPIDVEDNTEPGVSSAKRKVKSFDDVNRQTQERLEKMNRSKYQVVLDALDRASGVVGTVRSKVGGIAGKTFSFSLKVLDVATAPLRGILNLVTSIEGAVLGATGAFAGIYQPMSLAGDYEQTVVAFNTLLGSAEKATKFLAEAQEFANKTPFEFPELLNSSKLLLAFGFEAENVLDMMETIGDTSSGLCAGSEGIDRITRALGQMYAKGRVQAEELLQLQELGVPAAEILQEELGLTAEQVANIGNESVNASLAIQALLTGMDKRFGGMMDNQSKTAKGMISTIKDTIQNNLIRNWGEGLWEGIKPGLEEVTNWLDENQDTVAEWGEAWREAGANISKWVMDKVDGLRKTISDLVNSREWQEAETFGEKISLAWNAIIAEPFNEWWSSTGQAWLTEKAASIGKGLGSAITTGLLGLLGIDVSDALEDGKTVGGSFIEGFQEGFDTEQITAALKTWASENKEIVAAIGIGIGAKMLGGIITGLGKLAELKNLFGGKGSKAAEAAGRSGGSRYTTTTMNVTASVVNVYGNSVGNRAATVANAAGATGSLLPALPGAGTAAGRVLTGATQVALPGTVASTAAGGAKAAWLAQAPGGVIGSLLAKAGVALGSGASTAAGAVAAGAAGIGGGILGGVGIIDGIRNIIRGTQTSGKEAQDEYAKGGTKIGMVGAGAAAGAAIGSVVPVVGTGIGALVGAGVGGIGALLGGDSLGQVISDALDEGGALSTFWENTKETAGNAWEAIKTGASDAGAWVSEKIGSAGDWISEKWSGFSEWFDSSVWTPVKDVGISAINIAAGAWGSAKESISEGWADFSGWFDENIWTPVTEAAQEAGEWISERWTEAKQWVSEGWADFTSWFDSNVWEPVKEAAATAGQWIEDRWTEARTWVGERWSDFSTWFDESIWTPIKTGAQNAATWVSTRWTEAKTFLSESWQTVSTWFSESVWEPLKTAAKDAGEWLGDKFTAAKDAIHTAWTGVSTWFEDNVWTPIKNGATAAWNWVGEKLDGIGVWIGNQWNSFTDWLGGLGQKGSEATGLTTSQGKSTVLEHAWGGIMTKPHMGIVAEDGAESIIPLSPSKRGRGVDLWEKTGQALGVQPYADGGIVGTTDEDSTVPLDTGSTGGPRVDIHLEMTPQFVIEARDSGLDEEGIVAIIKARIREMVDDISDELAERLARVFANMPVKGGA